MKTTEKVWACVPFVYMQVSQATFFYILFPLFTDLLIGKYWTAYFGVVEPTHWEYKDNLGNVIISKTRKNEMYLYSKSTIYLFQRDLNCAAFNTRHNGLLRIRPSRNLRCLLHIMSGLLNSSIDTNQWNNVDNRQQMHK